MSFIVLDTDVASTILRGRLTDPLRSRLAGHSLCITFVTLGELTKWTVLRDWGPRRLADLEAGGNRSFCSPSMKPWQPSGAKYRPMPSSEGVRAQSTTVG